MTCHLMLLLTCFSVVSSRQ